ncbi:DUF3306 domain-containing protein [Marivita sp. S0852]|uniref:DUF3306 domain-containing protein n=1 Tax=Marivita sp. S0852 TaxID=3373893 RepID=UPI003981E3D0
MKQRSNFWSRRKQAVEAEALEEKRDAADAENRAVQAELEEKPDQEVLEELGLPDPDTLEPGQDISGFMQKAVPERLRQRALRQLWKLNPALANLDGLCDYNDDFTNAATDAPGVATAYRVGKGLLKHIEALEAEETRTRAEIAAKGLDNPQNLSDLPSDDGDTEEAEFVQKSETLQDSANAAPASTTMVPDAAEYPDGTPLDTMEQEHLRPRRMRFRIESETG